MEYGVLSKAYRCMKTSVLHDLSNRTETREEVVTSPIWPCVRCESLPLLAAFTGNLSFNFLSSPSRRLEVVEQSMADVTFRSKEISGLEIFDKTGISWPTYMSVK
jgi:hypothetical protein